MYTHPFFEATPPGAAPGPPVKTGARVRHFRGCNQISARDLIIHGPAQRGANGAAMPTDENDQDGHCFFNHRERGGNCAA